MPKYTKVGVLLQPDEAGKDVPAKIVWTDDTEYPIKRILHVYHPEDMVVAYTILIGNVQRKLFYNGSEWRISVP